jgi:hypothetical protein
LNELVLKARAKSTRFVALGALLIVLAFACVAVMSAFGKGKLICGDFLPIRSPADNPRRI